MANVILSDVIDIISGGTPKTSESKYWSGGNIDWLSINDFNNGNRFVYSSEKKITELALKESNIKLLNKGDVIISARGTVGVLAQIGKPMCFNQSCFGLRGKKELIDNDFLYYVLKNYIHNLKKKSQGSVFDTINIKSFDLMEIDIPNYASQCDIASVLSVLDQKIELNNHINTELEAMAKTLYDYWFVQFDFPNEEGKPYKSSGGKMVYNSILKREIPLGWKTESILNNCNIIDCLHSKKPDLVWESENYYLLQLENILDNGLIDISEKYYVSQKDYFIWTSRIELKQHDIVMTNAGRTAAFAQIPNHINCGIGRNITAIRPINISPNYFFLSLSSIDIQRQILISLDNGAFFKSFNVRGIKALQLLRPINKIEHKFEDTIKSIIDKRNLLVKENFELKKLRDWLLPMLMNGQVTVK
ncbi:restriction endonuclease subunit S [Snodgrassella alvi]|uniref:restriction endonuclease subunit S n=1 Tax=Snodgrassella alvi TaxID=1196083 RepID=UPI00345F1EC2